MVLLKTFAIHRLTQASRACVVTSDRVTTYAHPFKTVQPIKCSIFDMAYVIPV